MPRDSQNLVDSVLELWNTGRAELAEQLYTETALRYDPNQPNPARGRQEITRYVSEVRAGFPDFKIDIREAIAAEGHLVTHWTCTGTHRGEFKGIPATNKPIEIKGVALARIENNKVSEEHVYFDRLTMLEQLGVSPGFPESQMQHAGHS